MQDMFSYPIIDNPLAEILIQRVMFYPDVLNLLYDTAETGDLDFLRETMQEVNLANDWSDEDLQGEALHQIYQWLTK